ncbi:hypothetical protein F751_6112 [Auxenochlorella protothecoides]|uniref:Uncharacterized protein n=1 Tax=Auxenochlorella protothecoides TaxID=3075 RepID=A0A087SHF2_AUXPR|nr:hypothetical protein F751_6112 [Auxenochlorella protothecoides]KFM25156.1 hypothetical protein F751_6112 [Auxenochlorella protothecoides]
MGYAPGSSSPSGSVASRMYAARGLRARAPTRMGSCWVSRCVEMLRWLGCVSSMYSALGAEGRDLGGGGRRGMGRVGWGAPASRVGQATRQGYGEQERGWQAGSASLGSNSPDWGHWLPPPRCTRGEQGALLATPSTTQTHRSLGKLSRHLEARTVPTTNRS